MTNKSLLAAVHAAANDFSATALSVKPEETETMTDKPAMLTAITTIAALSAAFPDLCASLRTEGRTEGLTAGADAERSRLLGIAELADAGTAALVLEMQKDGKTTPAEAALRILGAQKAARGQQLQAIADVETATGLVKPAPSSAAAPAAPAKMNAHELAAKARTYQDEQAKIGNRISAGQAVVHIESLAG